MPDHDHTERVSGCFRCETSADEVIPDEAVRAVARELGGDQWDEALITAEDALAAARPHIERQVLNRAAVHLEQARQYEWNGRPRKVNGWASAAAELRRLARGLEDLTHD